MTPSPSDDLDALMADPWIARLADVADQVLAGTPVESFGLDDTELNFVYAYCRKAVGDTFGEGE